MRSCSLLFVVLALLPAAALAALPDPALLGGLKARTIGPAAMSGRVTAVEAVPEDPRIVYVGAAAGGLWKTVNGGTTWTPVFDREDVHSIGAVALDPGNPNTVWVGTGEGNVRNSTSIGRGVWRSTDGGASWRHLGLAGSERIHRIVVHPRDPDTVWVGAMGPLWGEGGERGVYKTTDGGRSWRRVLAGEPAAGVADLVLDPGNPNTLFAALWQVRRSPHDFVSGGPGSGLWRSDDGGETWNRLGVADGLPAGDLGRITLAIPAADPRVVYAMVEAKDNVLLRSDDGGRRFAVVNKETNVNPRPFYFGDIRVDPERPDRVYRLAVTLDVSNDGGRSFAPLIGWEDLHPDHHALWIHPRDGRVLINGNDGGVGFSVDRGETWRYAANLPLSQFYHVRVDDQQPYRIYGGLQDNGGWRGPSAVWEAGPIRNHHWVEVHFGDGFDVAPDPEHPERGYALSQQGYLVRWDLATGMRKLIRPATEPGQPKLRFHWNTAFAQDPFDPATIYLGSQFVHRSADRGERWTTISPDLTTNRAEWQRQSESGGLTRDVTGAENRTTLIAIAPSPRERGVLWVGSDDGRVHVTRDGGARWSAIEGRLRGAPAGAYVAHIHASEHDAGTAFLVLDAHRDGDHDTYVYRVDDYGARATRLDDPTLDGWALAIVQDPQLPQLLFLGTELGLFVSIDGGARWSRFHPGMPRAISAMDLVIHPREHDLVVATHGRGLFVIDDLRPLRALARDGAPAALTLLGEAEGLHRYTVPQGAGARFPGNADFAGDNEPAGATISFWIAADDVPHPDPERERERRNGGAAIGKPEASTVAIAIRDAEGRVLRTAEVEAHQGLNRWTWDLTRTPVRSPTPPRPFAPALGVPVLPGEYAVALRFRQERAEGQVRVGFDARLTDDPAARAARERAQLRTAALQDTIAAGVERLDDARTDIERLKALGQQALDARRRLEPAVEIPESDPQRAFLTRADAALKALREAEQSLWSDPKTVKGYAAPTDALTVLRDAVFSLNSSWDAPTPAALRYLAIAEETLGAALAKVNAVLDGELAAVSSQAATLGLAPLQRGDPLTLPRE